MIRLATARCMEQLAERQGKEISMRKLLITGILVCIAGMVMPGLVQCGAIEKIKSRGYLVAGVKDSVVPFGYTQQGSDRIIGFDVDICEHISDKLGVALKIKTVTADNRLSMLTQGSVDMLAAAMTHTFARDEVIDFSLTYFKTGQKILVRKEAGIASVEDLEGKKVGIVKGSTSEQNIKKAQPECTAIPFESPRQAFKALQQGKIAAVTTDEAILLGLKSRAEDPASWRVVGKFISTEPYGLGVPENDSDFRDFINRTLADMWNSGAYLEIYRKWFGPDTDCHLPLVWTMQPWPY